MVAFPPYGLWAALPAALALIVAGSFTHRWYTALISGFIAGICAFVPLFSWANIYAGLAPWIALAALEALFFAAFSCAARLIYLRRGITVGSAAGVAFVWGGIEVLRSSLPWGGLPWAISAFAYAESPLLNFGPWIGTVGLGVVSGFLGATLFACAMSCLGRRRRGRRGINAVWPLTVIISTILIALVTPRPPAQPPADHSFFKIAAVQGNVAPPPPGSYYLPKEMFGNHVAATEKYVRGDSGAQLVVWPEDSTGWDLPSDPYRLQQVTELSRAAAAPILVGSQVPHGDSQRLNKALLIAADGIAPQEYAKQHPVPFGEYIPARGFFSALSNKTDLVSMDMAPGHQPGVFSVDGTRIGVLICFEIAYEPLVRDTTFAGAQMLVVQSNNALFGNSHEAIQQRAQARVFSVVSGKSVVHVSTVGHSAIYSPDGHILDSLEHWESGTMEAAVPLRNTLTPAMKHGRVITIATIVAAALALTGAALTQPRKERSHR